jgi:hypothetical protein
MWRKVVVTGLLVCVLWCPAPVAAQESGDSAWGNAGWGVLSVLTNVVYIPAKVAYAGVGTVVGGLAYVLTLGDAETAQKIWDPSLGGTYVVTPGMLRGDERISFSGSSSPQE